MFEQSLYIYQLKKKCILVYYKPFFLCQNYTYQNTHDSEVLQVVSG